MDVNHVHFYVDQTATWRNWFQERLGFRTIAHSTDRHTHTEVLSNGNVSIILTSPLSFDSSIAGYLTHHPNGIADIAFRVASLEDCLTEAIANSAQITRPLQSIDLPLGTVKWAQVQGWKDLRHTLVESPFPVIVVPPHDRNSSPLVCLPPASSNDAMFAGIDHVVLNVANGDLQKAVKWYEAAFGFRRQQTFNIETDCSGLSSQVLGHPHGSAQLPINQPTSDSSQIQEFLNANGGAGVQHIALQTTDLIQTVANLRQRGLQFLTVPSLYYDQLRQRLPSDAPEVDWQAIADQRILVDWQVDLPQVKLLQIFTKPIFPEPTFFFELIERQTCYINQQYHRVQGFGEGNFRALFEAIEREQVQRGTLSRD